MAILVFNAGSATLKFALLARKPLGEVVLGGSAERFGAGAQLRYTLDGRTHEHQASIGDPAQAAAYVIEQLLPKLQFAPPQLVAHRFVHGGSLHRPLRLQARRLAELEALVPLAPLHMKPALAVARCAGQLLGESIPAYAVFDTAYFHQLPAAAQQYALPEAVRRQHALRRYGFHGLAHRSLYEGYCRAQQAPERSARVISLQLGNGCSAAAIDRGTPLDCSMGFTPLEGLVMGTRAGDIDPGIVLQLLRAGMSVDEVDDMLQRRSGLLGLSGETGDMRRLLQLEHDGHAGACLAIEVFCQRVRKYIGAYLAVLGGADAIVFGGGIGEHAAEIRSRCLRGFEWAGLCVDSARNRSGGPRIHADGSRIGAHVIHTDEERVIAADAAAALSEEN
ncbi:MAG: acetate/propionate family kinase [Pseudomonadota bacterium]